MSPASNDASMLAVANPAPLCPTVLAVASCTRQYANLLVPGQIVSGLVRGANEEKNLLVILKRYVAESNTDTIQLNIT
jgi:hypothetical protein